MPFKRAPWTYPRTVMSNVTASSRVMQSLGGEPTAARLLQALKDANSAHDDAGGRFPWHSRVTDRDSFDKQQLVRERDDYRLELRKYLWVEGCCDVFAGYQLVFTDPNGDVYRLDRELGAQEWSGCLCDDMIWESAMLKSMVEVLTKRVAWHPLARDVLGLFVPSGGGSGDLLAWYESALVCATLAQARCVDPDPALPLTPAIQHHSPCNTGDS